MSRRRSEFLSPTHQQSLSVGLLIALGLVSTSVPIATDLYLAAFPALVTEFSVSPATVQLTQTGAMLGVALGQIFVGAVSDALGRRRTLLIGYALFALASFAVGLAPSIEVLILLRVLQGFAASAGAVLGRAVIADLTTGEETARAYSVMFVIIGLAPALSNPLGAFLTEHSGWRAPLVATGIIASLVLLLTFLKVPETLQAQHRHEFRFGVLARNLVTLTKRPAFMGYALAFAFGYAALATYISMSSFIGQEVFELSPTQYSFTFMLTATSFVLGAFLSGRFVRWFTPELTAQVAQAVLLATAGTLVVLALLHTAPLPVYLVCAAIVCASCGTIMSTVSAIAVRQAVGVIGAGSALVGFLQFVIAAAAAPLGSLFGETAILPAASVITGFAVLSIISRLVGKNARLRTKTVD